MRWATAVKMWNLHKKIYDDKHVYAFPRKGTAEYDDVKHVMTHKELPSHLHKKAPIPEKVIKELLAAEKPEGEAVKKIVSSLAVIRALYKKGKDIGEAHSRGEQHKKTGAAEMQEAQKMFIDYMASKGIKDKVELNKHFKEDILNKI